MALQTAAPITTPAPHVVGNAFVHQYYHVLLTSPDLLHRFYQDSSIPTPPDLDGVKPSAINDKLLSYNFNRSEIESIDSQASYHNGVMIFVTGCLTGNDNVRRRFTQSFFLAPQGNGGFFVLNDIFRFLDQTKESDEVLANGITDDTPKSPPSLAPVDTNLIQENHAGDLTSPPSERVPSNHEEEVVIPSENGSSGVEDKVTVDPPVQKQSHELPIQEVATSVTEEDGHNKSYASIVKVMKESMPQKSANVPNMAKIPAKAAEKPVNLPTTSAVPTLESRKSSSNNAPQIINSQDGYSVYIQNLPLNATTEEVLQELKKFGTIKPGGVQVRNHKVDRFCFGFVEFESETAMQDAIKASPITMVGRQVFIEEKRTTTRVVNGVVISNGNGRGRFAPGRGRFRNDNFRGHGGNFAGNNQGYRRVEFRNRDQFSGHGRGRGLAGHFGEGYQHRAIQNGNGSLARPVVVNQAAVSA